MTTHGVRGVSACFLALLIVHSVIGMPARADFSGDIANAVDIDGVVFTSYTDGSAGEWFPTSGVTHDGTDAARSGAIGSTYSYSAESGFYTEITGPQPVSFWWKVDCQEFSGGYGSMLSYTLWNTSNPSERYYDFISGDVDWTQVQFNVPSGNYTLLISYLRSASSSAGGSDAGWVDQMQIGGSPGPSPGAPQITACADNGQRGVTLAWELPQDTEAPLQYLILSYDVYLEEWVPHPDPAWPWYPVAAGTSDVDLDMPFAGAFFFWVAGQYPDGSAYLCENPGLAWVQSDRTHPVRDLSATDLGSRTVRVDWTPDPYGTYLYWMILFDVVAGDWASVSGPQGDATWQYVAYGDSGYDSGSAELIVGQAGPYFVFMQGAPWTLDGVGYPSSTTVWISD